MAQRSVQPIPYGSVILDSGSFPVFLFHLTLTYNDKRGVGETFFSPSSCISFIPWAWFTMGSISGDKVALVFGASGISGWAVTRSLLEYPTRSTFSRVIGLTHRPQTRGQLSLPDDPRLEVYSGINLRDSLDEVMTQMCETIPHLDQITHVYYLGKTSVICS